MDIPETKSGVNIKIETWVDDFIDSHLSDELVETISSEMKVCGGIAGDLLEKLLTQMDELGLVVLEKDLIDDVTEALLKSLLWEECNV